MTFERLLKGKMPMKNPLHLFITLLMLLALTAGCTTNIKPSVETNPAPAEKFSAFNRFELLPVQAATSEVSNQQAAMKKIEENTQNILGKRLQQLNSKPQTGQPRTLLIEPTVTELKFVSGGKRFWAGAMAGSSAVVLKAKFTEKETGKLIANPEFYS
jgi:PBP1b-binding outer membrane lipoprotein LpoB